MRRIFLISEWEDMRTPGAVSEVQLTSFTVLLEAGNSQRFVLVGDVGLDPLSRAKELTARSAAESFLDAPSGACSLRGEPQRSSARPVRRRQGGSL